LPSGYLVSGDNSGIIILWNTDIGIEIRNLTGHNGTVNALAVLPNGYLASADAKIKIWNSNDGSLIRTLPVNSIVYSLAVLPNGYLVSGSFDTTIKMWNTADGSLIRTLTGHSWSVRSLAVLPNGYLASGSEDRTIRIWNTNEGPMDNLLN
jgi:WD40 repeat protein